ncbi:MAG: O-antigen ligase family protein [Planctomycetota bacterium]
MIALGATVMAASTAAAYLCSPRKGLAVLLFFLAFVPFATLDPTQGGLVEAGAMTSGGNAVWKLATRALGMAGVAALAAARARDVAAVLVRPASLPILFFIAWATLGLPRASDPWVAFFRLGELFTFFLAGTVLYVEVTSRRSAHEAGRVHALALVAPLVCAVVFAHAFPEIAFHESSGGIRRMGHKFMNSNVLGFCAAAAGLWATYVLRAPLVLARAEDRPARGERLLAVLVLALSLYVLYHARSRTAALTAALGQAMLWFPWPHALAAPGADGRRARSAALGALGLVACVLALGWGSAVEWFLRGADAADVASGTGRTGLWRDLLAVRVPEAPMLGSGYLNLGPEGTFEHAGHRWNNAHNTYLFALVSTGLPGLASVVLIVALPLWGAWRSMGRGEARERHAFTLVFALQCVVAAASVTGFGVSGYPNVAMLFHYGLYALSTASLGAAEPSARSSRPAALFPSEPAPDALRPRPFRVPGERPRPLETPLR